MHTASTFLVNALYGLIPGLFDKKIIGHWNDNIEKIEEKCQDIIVLKAHENIGKLIKRYSDKYNLFFICSERKEKKYFIEDEYKSYKNVLVFDYNELNETENNSIPEIISNIHLKVKRMLNIELNINLGIERIYNMNKRYNEIKHLSFDYIDDFYEIHGSHRNRKK
jgi:hypothetical protein